jgi:ABC-type transport system substrate-binding protein
VVVIRRRPVRRAAAAALIAASLFVSGCSGGSEAPSATTGSGVDLGATLKAMWVVGAVPLDPHKAASTIGQFPYVSLVYDRLTQMGPGGEVLPMVATEWKTSADGREVTFRLRDDVTFSDGAKLDAAAVKSSLERAMTVEGSTAASYLEMVDSVEAPDATTVLIRTNRPAADLPYTLATAVGSIISPRALNNADLDVRPVGSGPYTVSNVVLGNSVTYERREGYWDPSAQGSKTVILSGVPDDNARLNAVRSGQADFVMIQANRIDAASKLGGGTKVETYPPVTRFAMALNTDRIPDVRVRQALNFAIDREAINSAFLGGRCEPSNQPLASSVRGHLATPPIQYTRDLTKAKALLQEANATGVKLTMLAPSTSPFAEIATALQAQLAEVGVKVSIETADNVKVNTLWAGGTYDAYFGSRPGGSFAPAILRDNYLVKTRYPATLPDGFAEAVKGAFDSTLSDSESLALLEDASAIAVKNALEAYVCAVPQVIVHGGGVVGLDKMGMADQNIFDLRYIAKSK